MKFQSTVLLSALFLGTLSVAQRGSHSSSHDRRALYEVYRREALAEAYAEALAEAYAEADAYAYADADDMIYAREAYAEPDAYAYADIDDMIYAREAKGQNWWTPTVVGSYKSDTIKCSKKTDECSGKITY